MHNTSRSRFDKSIIKTSYKHSPSFAVSSYKYTRVVGDAVRTSAPVGPLPRTVYCCWERSFGFFAALEVLDEDARLGREELEDSRFSPPTAELEPDTSGLLRFATPLFGSLLPRAIRSPARLPGNEALQI